MKKNVDMYHHHLNDIIEVESTNHGVPFDKDSYGGLPWADKMNFQVLKTSQHAMLGEIGLHGRPAVQKRVRVIGDKS